MKPFLRRTLSVCGLVLLLGVAAFSRGQGEKQKDTRSIEEKTKVHRLSTTKRAPFDAFVYVNRIPEKRDEGETPIDFAGRVFGRLANQEGRVLLKLPAGMDRKAYLGYKTFLRYEGKARVGNCVACHVPPEFTDFDEHIVTSGGKPEPTPSVRNAKKRKLDYRKILLRKIESSRAKRSGKAKQIADAYSAMNITDKDIPNLMAFLKLLEDVSDSEFRKLILEAKVLDTSEDAEKE